MIKAEFNKIPMEEKAQMYVWDLWFKKDPNDYIADLVIRLPISKEWPQKAGQLPAQPYSWLYLMLLLHKLKVRPKI